MADVATLKELIYKLQLEASGLETGLQKAEKETTKFSSKMQTLGEKIKKHWLGVTAAIGGALIGVKKTFDFTKEYAKYKQGMTALARNTGMNANKIVAKLKEVSKGTVANKDLMLAANRAVALGVTKDVNTIAKLLEIARVKAKAMGTDTTQAFDDIVTGIGRGSPLILDNLGIITKGWQEEAKAKGVSYDKQFMLNKILEQGAEELKKPGAQALTTAEKLAKLSAVFDDLKLQLGKLASEIILPFVSAITKVVKWFIKLPMPIKKTTAMLIGLIGAFKIFKLMLAGLTFNPVILGLTAAATAAIYLINKLKSGVEKAQQMKETLDSLEGTNISRGMSKELDKVNKQLKLLIEKYSVLDNINKKALNSEQKHYVEKYKHLIKYKKQLEEIIKKEKERLKAGMEGTHGKKKDKTGSKTDNYENEKATIQDYYKFVKSQYDLDLLNFQNSSEKAITALSDRLGIEKEIIKNFVTEKVNITAESLQEQLSLEDEQLSQITDLKAQYLMKQEQIKKEHEERMQRLNNLSVKKYNTNWENLTAKQKELVLKQYNFQMQILNGIKTGWKQTTQTIVSSYADGIAEMIVSGKVFKKSFGDFIKDILKGLAKMIIKLIIIKSLMLVFGGIGSLLFSKGGKVPKLSKGGKIEPVYAANGFEPKGTDTVPAMLTPGERVLSVAQNKAFENFIKTFSNIIAMPTIPKVGYADGGVVTNATNEPTKAITINNEYNITGEVIDDIAFKDFTKKIMVEQEKILANNEVY